jgi:hypothetical protein
MIKTYGTMLSTASSSVHCQYCQLNFLLEMPLARGQLVSFEIVDLLWSVFHPHSNRAGQQAQGSEIGAFYPIYAPAYERNIVGGLPTIKYSIVQRIVNKCRRLTMKL